MMRNPVKITKINYNGPSRIQYSGTYSSSVTYTNIPIITHSVDYPIGDYPIDINATQQNVNTTGAPAFQNHEEQKC